MYDYCAVYFMIVYISKKKIIKIHSILFNTVIKMHRYKLNKPKNQKQAKAFASVSTRNFGRNVGRARLNYIHNYGCYI